MRNKLLMALAALVVAALACALPGSDGSLFKDDFSRESGDWGTGDDGTGSVTYEDGHLVFRIHEEDQFYWTTAEEDLENIHLEVTVRDTGEAEDAGFGVLCNHVDDQNFYYLGIGSDQLYVIAKIEDDEFEVISGEEQWSFSDDLALNADSYRIGADCGNGTLTLYVDGVEIASVEDSTFTSGNIGLFTVTAQDPDTEVRFDDIVVTKLGE